MHDLLIVEDDNRLVEMLSIHLRKLDCNITHANDGEKGLRLAQEGDFDLIILDRSLPGLEGLEVCREIRKTNSDVRILMLTALTEELDMIVGLETGADDYIGKPFRVGELSARVSALLRRRPKTIEANEAPQIHVYGDLSVDLEKREVAIGNVTVELTAKEFDLLIFLSKHPGRAYTREQILQNVWGCAVSGYEYSINTIIGRLRKKIESNPSDPKYIQTVRGIGYRFSSC